MSIADEILELQTTEGKLATDKTNIEAIITTKGGTLSQNSGFDTFATDIATIPSGGHDYFADYLKGTLTEYTYNETTIKDAALLNSDLKILHCPNLSQLSSNCIQYSLITHIYAPSATRLKTFSCAYTSYLTLAYFPKVTNMEASALRGYQDKNYFKTITLPSITAIPSACFLARPSFERIVLGENIVSGEATVVSLGAIASFNETKFDATNGTGGIAYVPRNLISDYEEATNWSALNCTFKPIDTETLSGDGSTTTFTLTATTDEVFYVKNGSDFPEYTYDDTTGIITFTTAPASGTNNITVYYKGAETV